MRWLLLATVSLLVSPALAGPTPPSWTPSQVAAILNGQNVNLGTGNLTAAKGTFSGALSAGSDITTTGQHIYFNNASGGAGYIQAQGTTSNIFVNTSSTGLFRVENAGTSEFDVGPTYNKSYLTLILGPSGTWSGSSYNGNAALNESMTWSGTSTANPTCLHCVTDTTNLQPSSGATDNFYINTLIGASSKGSANGLAVNLTFNSTTANTVSHAYGGITSTVTVSSTDTVANAFTALNPVLTLTSAATGLGGGSGEEIDVGFAASAPTKIGLLIDQMSTDTTQATTDDIALALDAQNGTTSKWKYGLSFGRSGGFFPFGSSSTLIYGEGNGGASWTVQNGIDWHLGTATSYWVQYGSVFSINGSGNTSIGGTLGVTGAATFNSTLTQSGGNGLTAGVMNTPSSTSQLVFKNGPAGNIILLIGGSGFEINPDTDIALPGGTWGSGALTNNKAPLFQNTTYAGSTTSASASFGAFLQQTDNSSNTANGIGLTEHLIVNGSSAVGGREAGQFTLDIAQTGDSTRREYVGLGSKCNLTTTTPAGATSTTASSCFGMNPVSWIGPGVTADQNVGTEVDTWESYGAVMQDRIGQQIVDVTGTAISIASISWSSGTVTVVTSSAHGFSTGQSVVISGVAPVGYDGTYTVTVTNSTTFTYALVSNPGTETALGFATLAYGVQASRDDVALSLNNQYAPSATLGFKTGLEFGRAGGSFPVANNGTLIYGQATGGGSWTVANGIDWHLGTATSYWVQYGSVFSINGSGNTSIGGTLTVAGTGTYNAGQAVTPNTVAIATSTFTPDFSKSNNFNITLVHASCPCTLANPSNIQAGQSGLIIINQSATGSDTIGTWGSYYKFSGGTKPTLSTGASAIDVLSYYAIDTTHIVVSASTNYQ